MNAPDLNFRRRIGRIFRAAQTENQPIELFFVTGGTTAFRLANCQVDTAAPVPAAQARRISTILRAAVREAEGEDTLRCFAPHHAVRVQTKAETLELLVCFQCATVRAWFSADNSYFIAPITARALPLFNEFLPDYETKLREMSEKRL